MCGTFARHGTGTSGHWDPMLDVIVITVLLLIVAGCVTVLFLIPGDAPQAVERGAADDTNLLPAQRKRPVPPLPTSVRRPR